LDEEVKNVLPEGLTKTTGVLIKVRRGFLRSLMVQQALTYSPKE